MRDPGGVLGDIVAHKQSEVAARLAGQTIEDVRGRAEPTQRDFAAALARPGARFVMEIKRASPSRGAISDIDPVAAARAYDGAADCVSVLTDTKYFGGSLDVLRAVRGVLDVPLLCKDFMVDPRQVPEARAHGADAILVMLSVLEDDEARAIMEETARWNMAALVEVHDEAEMARAAALGATLIGINNRDLRSLQTDLAVTETLAAKAPAGAVLISESGVADRADVERLAPLVDGFLVGSSLMASDDLRGAARALAFGRVKICGLTRAEDLLAARAFGAAYGGLILVPGTPRAVDLERARALADAAREGAALPLVGVFRDADAAEVAEAAGDLGLAAVQLHGFEDDATISAVRAAAPDGVEVWKALSIDVRRGVAPPVPAMADRTVFDASVMGRSGGTGQAFDWSVLDGRDDLARGVLAGGVGPDNAAAARDVGAWAIDAASGVEDSPGVKSHDKMAALFAALRAPSRGEGKTA